jgi:hypothetical protein
LFFVEPPILEAPLFVPFLPPASTFLFYIASGFGIDGLGLEIVVLVSVLEATGF